MVFINSQYHVTADEFIITVCIAALEAACDIVCCLENLSFWRIIETQITPATKWTPEEKRRAVFVSKNFLILSTRALALCIVHHLNNDHRPTPPDVIIKERTGCTVYNKVIVTIEAVYNR
jgi:hypothetical protein